MSDTGVQYGNTGRVMVASDLSVSAWVTDTVPTNPVTTLTYTCYINNMKVRGEYKQGLGKKQ